MRAVGMLRTGFILVLVIISYASTLPLQYLPSIPGYVPVYIRNGDEPLEDINLALAEAFAEHSSSKILKNSNIVLEVEQPVDYELISNAQDEGGEKMTFDVSEPAGKVTEEKNNDVNAETLPPQDPVAPKQRQETNRSNLQKKSEAVTLEVNRSRIPQLLTAQEHEDEQISDSTGQTDKPNPISVSKEATIEVSSVVAKEKEDLEKLASEVEKSDFKPNEVLDPNPNYPELPAEILQQHNSQDFGSPAEGHQDVASSPMVILQDEPSRDESGSKESSGESEESVENDSSSASSNSESNESK